MRRCIIPPPLDNDLGLVAFEPDSPCVDDVAPAVNFNTRRGAGFRRVGRPDMLLLHYTGTDDEDAALRWLTAPESGVSCHYFVRGDGTILQLLPEAARAFHAGQSFWHGETDNNSRSIGIEIAHPGHLEVDRGGSLGRYGAAQMEAVVRLCVDIATRHAIPPERVLAHSDVAPARKRDPGEAFGWDALHDAGVGRWVSPVAARGDLRLGEGDEGEDVRKFQSRLATYGYETVPSGFFCRQTHLAVTAFQRHFRPGRVDGVIDYSTVRTLGRLLAASTLDPAQDVIGTPA